MSHFSSSEDRFQSFKGDADESETSHSSEDEVVGSGIVVRLATLAAALSRDLLRMREQLCYGQHQSHYNTEARFHEYRRGGSPLFRLLLLGPRHVLYRCSVSQNAQSMALTTASSTPSAFLYSLPVKERMCFIGRRTLFMSLCTVIGNGAGCIRSGVKAPAAFWGRSMYRHGNQLRAALLGVPQGVMVGALYLGLGLVVSPALHILWGARNQCVTFLTIVRPNRIFDPLVGRYIVSSNLETAALCEPVLKRQFDDIVSIGKGEFAKRQLSSTVRKLLKEFRFAGSIDVDPDHYQTLGLKRNATQQQIKDRYKKLAYLYHPDRNSDPEARQIFDKVAASYKVLGSPAERREYDINGNQGVRLREQSKQSAGMNAFLRGAPDEIMTRLFGGVPFEEHVIGYPVRSHYHMQTQARCLLSLQEVEALQTIRARILSVRLLSILDVHALRPLAASCNDADNNPADFSDDFLRRCEKFVSTLERCSFGPELLREVGECYVIAAKRSLGEAPFYAPRMLSTKKLLQSIGRLNSMFVASLSASSTKEELATRFFNLEWDNLIVDFHIVGKWVCSVALSDTTAGEAAKAHHRSGHSVRRRRCCALKHLGERMIAKGKLWQGMTAQAGAARVSAAATSTVNTKPIVF